MPTLTVHILIERRKSSTEEDYKESNIKPSSSRTHTSEEMHKLKPFMVDVNAYFHDVIEEDVKKLTRYLIAYPLKYVGYL